MERIRIAPGVLPETCEIIIEPGIIRAAGRVIRELLSPHTCVVISDDRVASLYGNEVLDSVRAAGIEAALLTFPAGEANKTLATWQSLTERMMQLGAGRDSCVVALGGGVVGDVAGFVAATYMRGVPVIQLPTTVVAMIDSSIGGKTGVDTTHGKNLVGAFHQPRAVLVDPLALRTLPDPELRGGLAEAIKHGAIADAAYLHWLRDAATDIADRSLPELTRLIRGSVDIKAAFVSMDAHEAGPRAALNFGHTIGHAIERVSEYRIAHGEAVAIGMCIEARCGAAAGITAPGTAAALSRVIEEFGLPTHLPEAMSADTVLERTRSDKKSRGGRSRYTLIAEIGRIARTEDGGWTHELPDDLVRDAMVGNAARDHGLPG